jgi:hypothetical protein
MTFLFLSHFQGVRHIFSGLGESQSVVFSCRKNEPDPAAERVD